MRTQLARWGSWFQKGPRRLAENRGEDEDANPRGAEPDVEERNEEAAIMLAE